MTRKPMQVDTLFEEKLKKLQIAIRKKKGEEMSLREITKQVVKDPNFERIEAKLLGKNISNINVNLKLDGRIFE